MDCQILIPISIILKNPIEIESIIQMYSTISSGRYSISVWRSTFVAQALRRVYSRKIIQVIVVKTMLFFVVWYCRFCFVFWWHFDYVGLECVRFFFVYRCDWEIGYNASRENI